MPQGASFPQRGGEGGVKRLLFTAQRESDDKQRVRVCVCVSARGTNGVAFYVATTRRHC